MFKFYVHISLKVDMIVFYKNITVNSLIPYFLTIFSIKTINEMKKTFKNGSHLQTSGQLNLKKFETKNTVNYTMFLK